jgi:hypothetical protein
VLGTPPLWVLINAPVERMVWLAFIMALFTGVMSSTVGPNLRWVPACAPLRFVPASPNDCDRRGILAAVSEFAARGEHEMERPLTI